MAWLFFSIRSGPQILNYCETDCFSRWATALETGFSQKKVAIIGDLYPV